MMFRVVSATIRSAVHGDDTETVCFFTAEVEGEQAEWPFFRVIAVHGGPASDIPLMIRPFDALLAGVKAMGRQRRPRPEAG